MHIIYLNPLNHFSLGDRRSSRSIYVWVKLGILGFKAQVYLMVDATSKKTGNPDCLGMHKNEEVVKEQVVKDEVVKEEVVKEQVMKKQVVKWISRERQNIKQ